MVTVVVIGVAVLVVSGVRMDVVGLVVGAGEVVRGVTVVGAALAGMDGAVEGVGPNARSSPLGVSPPRRVVLGGRGMLESAVFKGDEGTKLLYSQTPPTARRIAAKPTTQKRLRPDDVTWPSDEGAAKSVVTSCEAVGIDGGW